MQKGIPLNHDSSPASSAHWWDSASASEVTLPADSAEGMSLWSRILQVSLFEADERTAPLGRWLPLLWSFIGLVCAYDTYLSIKFSASLRYLERNPMGQWLLYLDRGDPALFMAAKFFTSTFVLAVLILTHKWYSKLCWVLTTAIALFQASLVGILLGSSVLSAILGK